MLITLKRYGIPIRKHYFAPVSPSWKDYLLPSAYMDCYTSRKPVAFQTEYRHTLITDLRPNEAEIFQNFPKDTRYQIRRCEQERRFSLNLHTTIEQLVALYTAFAQERGLSAYSMQDAENFKPDNYCIFSIEHEGNPIISHLYLLSKKTGVSNLLISASTSKYNEDQDIRRAMGHANRCLHWQGMKQLKAAGFHTYDWGGYALETDDPALQGINRFKKTFNGQLIPIYNYYSPSYVFIEQARQKLRQLKG
jgi:lipid II:glycine glycyltransferase (peptidoglycan interpeptide bridge formation enzyme)